MFGRDRGEKKEVKKEQEKAYEVFDCEYMGGHMLYPKKTDATVYLFSSHFEIRFGLVHKKFIEIPYESIVGIENEDESRITKTRILLTPLLVGLLWKKKFRYTVIEYEDQFGMKQGVVIDFHRKAEKAQQTIYLKMVESRSRAEHNLVFRKGCEIQ